MRCLRARRNLLKIFDQDGEALEFRITRADQTFDFTLPLAAMDYVRAEVRDPNGRLRALTNPIYFSRKP